jgi:hypothetical protein
VASLHIYVVNETIRTILKRFDKISQKEQDDDGKMCLLCVDYARRVQMITYTMRVTKAHITGLVCLV